MELVKLTINRFVYHLPAHFVARKANAGTDQRPRVNLLLLTVHCWSLGRQVLALVPAALIATLVQKYPASCSKHPSQWRAAQEMIVCGSSASPCQSLVLRTCHQSRLRCSARSCAPVSPAQTTANFSLQSRRQASVLGLCPRRSVIGQCSTSSEVGAQAVEAAPNQGDLFWMYASCDRTALACPLHHV